ncbi:hypothetical protein [Sandaracinus amylolyticus]|uniref:Uncharacterized protein n=1 Tax=Sandaracinus amylolyticus TaxID=927083 RepID=A0A0F6W6N4_9BACT|nr:hypothetical protein [Sandaracinus amylolyticus]AKF08868.1 hypothetical protein DB32_006017 [Sandaracinus amylolyticus]
MSYAFVRIDAEATLHPKLLAVGPEAAWLWVCGLAHANRHTTNGLIMKSLLPSLYPDGSWSMAKLTKLARRLCDVRVPGSNSGLWHDDGDVYRIHDYEKQQEYALKENVEARREYERSRKREQRKGANVPDTNGTDTDPVPPMSGTSPGHSAGTPDGTPSGVPPTNYRSRSHTDPDPSLRSGSARAPTDGPELVFEGGPTIAGLAEQVWAQRIGARGGAHVMRSGDATHFRSIAEAAQRCRGDAPLRTVLESWFDEWVATRRSQRLRVEWWAEWCVERAARGGGVAGGWAPPRAPGSYGTTNEADFNRTLGDVSDEDLARVERGRRAHG